MLRRMFTVGGLTLVSRATGFLRDIMLAAILGAGPMADAFFVALRLPNHFRAIFAEGAFNAAFVPAYARVRAQAGPDPARLFADRVDPAFAVAPQGLDGDTPLPPNKLKLRRLGVGDMKITRWSCIALALLIFSSDASADEFSILTGGTSGVYYPVGVKLQEVFKKKIPEHSFKVLSTQATVENLNLLQRGSGILALAQGDILSEASKGNPEAGFPSSRTKIRLIGAAYPNFIHLLARKDAGIRSLRDLVGKRVSVGAARSGNELNARALLGAAGLSYADLLQVEYLRYGESVDLFVKDELDAILVSAGLGVAAVMEACKRTQVSFVPIEREFVEANAKMFFPISIPANSYPGQTSEVPTAALNNFFVTTSDASEEIVYRITKAIYNNLDSVRAVHPAANAITVQGALAIRPIEVHPGALRYFREQGVMQ